MIKTALAFLGITLVLYVGLVGFGTLTGDRDAGNDEVLLGLALATSAILVSKR